MSRQSVAANRPSHAAGLNPVNSAAAAAKFIEKKKEFDAVFALQRASALYLQRIEGLADDCETMADAGQSDSTRVIECKWSHMILQFMAKCLNNGLGCFKFSTCFARSFTSIVLVD